MFGAKKEYISIDMQIGQAEAIAIAENEAKKEQKQKHTTGLLAEGLLEAGKLVKQKQKEEMAELEKMQKQANKEKQYSASMVSREVGAQRRRLSEDELRTRRYARLGLLLEKYNPAFKEMTLDEIEDRMKEYFRENEE